MDMFLLLVTLGEAKGLNDPEKRDSSLRSE
jgi:hypothetical protein